jgi:hypothetical protein
MSFGGTAFTELNIDPSGEAITGVPVALTVPQQNEGAHFDELTALRSAQCRLDRRDGAGFVSVDTSGSEALQDVLGSQQHWSVNHCSVDDIHAAADGPKYPLSPGDVLG